MAVVEPSWANLGRSGARLGAILGSSWVDLWTVLGHLGTIFGNLHVILKQWAILKPWWDRLGSFWGHFGAVLGHLGPFEAYVDPILVPVEPILVSFLAISKHATPILTPSWAIWGHPGVH